MAEEHGFQAPEGYRLCANNCGFSGSPATLNLCSKCYMDFLLKDQPALVSGTFSVSDLASKPVLSPTDLKLPGPPEGVRVVESSVPRPDPVVAGPSWCLTCRRRVGLTGFKCRCGSVFCGSHRYAENHGCPFDYKKVGKEAIAKANPVVKAEKLENI